MTTNIQFPQGPFVDTQTGFVTLEWQQWLQNPQFVTVNIGTVLAVESGGTGIVSGTPGGVLAFTGSTTIASSDALGSNKIVFGGGTGVPSTPLGLGTTTTVLHGNAAGAPTWGAVSLSADVTGTLAPSHGGTGITSLGTGVAAALGANVGSAGAFVTFNGALGTPSSGVATNLTGTASGLTAGTVTTNANLTGPITSTGNATSVAAQTGTGSTFVMQTSPTLTTPTLGVADATSLGLAGFLHLATPAGSVQTAVSIYAGNGAPNNSDGANGDFYFRGDGSAGTFIYNKAAGSWTAFA